MAKDRFYPTKPHVNVARQRLRQAGMSTTGVEQLLRGNLVSSPNDRALIAQIVVQATMVVPRVGFEVLVDYELG